MSLDNADISLALAMQRGGARHRVTMISARAAATTASSGQCDDLAATCTGSGPALHPPRGDGHLPPFRAQGAPTRLPLVCVFTTRLRYIT